MECAENHGLEKLSSYALGLAAYCDEHRKVQWLGHLNTLTDHDRLAVREFFRKALGRDIAEAIWIIDPHRKELASKTQATAPVDLTIDQGTGRVIYKGKEHSLNKQSVLFNILVQLATSQKQGLTKAKLVQAVWGHAYDPVAHDSMIYTNIARLREIIPIELHQSQYRLPATLKWQMFAESDLTSRQELSDKHQSVYSLIQVNGLDHISRREVVKRFNMSPRTALRILNDLVEKRLLVRHGSGRSAHYSILSRGVGA